jgi:acetyl-CoA carboxylase biotin carboxyl carrier protein
MKLSESDIAEITQLLRDADFDDIELEWGDIYLRIARRSALGGVAAPAALAASAIPAPASVAAYTTGSMEAQPQPEQSAAVTEPSVAPAGIIEVKSALMGTLYRAPQPGDLPFVDVGTSVQLGDTLCLLEVMKVFTALKVETAGVIERVLVSDGDLVQYNQVIFWIRPE